MNLKLYVQNGETITVLKNGVKVLEFSEPSEISLEHYHDPDFETYEKKVETGWAEPIPEYKGTKKKHAKSSTRS